MTDSSSVFGDAWRECLRAHYKHAVRNNDQVTLKTLKPVLQNKIGFSDSELRQLYVEATMRADEIDFIPDFDALAEEPAAPAEVAPSETFKPHPLECQCPECVQINLVPHNDDGQPLDADQIAELEDLAAYEQNKADMPKQLSLF